MLRRPIAGALLLCYLAACTSWHVEEGVSPLQFITTEHPRLVRLTRADGSRMVLDQPRIAAGDSLAGVHNGAPSSVAVSLNPSEPWEPISARPVNVAPFVSCAAPRAVVRSRFP